MKFELNNKDIKAIDAACFYACALLNKEIKNNTGKLKQEAIEEKKEINRIWDFFKGV